ncbi:response regulator transcription factor [Parapedobacter lycopersici]|uniref:response regulator transcription factor n=1 Tax=Parapedobacter lycopersici TaxID=1864939 RepID=UPI00214D2EBE|nr:response regulator transcription factor [Parapedobacter lycopersici]
MEMITLIIIDDHPVVLQGFAYMLQDADNIRLIGQFTDAASGIRFIAGEQVDVVLLDINLPDKNGIDACAEIKQLCPDTKVVAISNINEYSIIQRMLDSGASGYLLKNSATEEVMECIRQVMRGETGISEGVRAILSSHQSGELPVVTRREKEVLALLADGLNSHEIGDKIFISPLTVESHRRNLLQKFKVTNVAALIRRATEMKYI